jgi:hypothetical protein
LELDHQLTNENPADLTPSYGLFTSPLTFSWAGSADDIGPYEPSVDQRIYGFTGGLSGTWEIPFKNHRLKAGRFLSD